MLLCLINDEKIRRWNKPHGRSGAVYFFLELPLFNHERHETLTRKSRNVLCFSCRAFVSFVVKKQNCIFLYICYMIGGILIFIDILLSWWIASKIGVHKKLGFGNTFCICMLLTPFFGYLIAEHSGEKDPRGCKWCGNKENEAEFCGLCGLNEKGEMSPHFKMK